MMCGSWGAFPVVWDFFCSFSASCKPVEKSAAGEDLLSPFLMIWHRFCSVRNYLAAMKLENGTLDLSHIDHSFHFVF
jgi:hypothetical protein